MIPLRINLTLTGASSEEITQEDRLFLSKLKNGEWEIVRYQQDAEDGTPIFCGNKGVCPGDWLRLEEIESFYHLS